MTSAAASESSQTNLNQQGQDATLTHEKASNNKEYSLSSLLNSFKDGLHNAHENYVYYKEKYAEVRDKLAEDEKFQEAITDLQQEFEKDKPGLQKWLNENWSSYWAEGSGDRWDAKNLEDGWDLEEVEQEFEDFFNEFGSEIVNEDHKDQDKFKAELDQAARFYNKGIASGKVKNMDGW